MNDIIIFAQVALVLAFCVGLVLLALLAVNKLVVLLKRIKKSILDLLH